MNSCPNSASSVRELIAEAKFGTLAVSEVFNQIPNSMSPRKHQACTNMSSNIYLNGEAGGSVVE